MPPPDASGSASSSLAGSVCPPVVSSFSAPLVELDELLLPPPPQAARARARAKTRSARIALLLNVTDDISLLRCERWRSQAPTVPIRCTSVRTRQSHIRISVVYPV